MSLAIVNAVFAADAGKLETWRPILDQKVHVRIGSRPPAVGLASAMAELKSFLFNVRSFGGRYREVWNLPDATLVEAEIVCKAAAGVSSRVIPCALVFRSGGGALALDVRFYLDPQPIFGSERKSGPGDELQ